MNPNTDKIVVFFFSAKDNQSFTFLKIFGDSPIVALSDVGNSRLLAVVAVIARDILANTAQEQAHVFRATMMLPTGGLTGVPCCAGPGSRGIKLRPSLPRHSGLDPESSRNFSA